MSGVEDQWDWRKKLVPDQDGRKRSHHARSVLASALRVMWWWRGVTVVLRSISLHKKMRPESTTLHAKASLLIMDRSSRFVHVRLPRSSPRAWRSSIFRCAVMDACIVVESRCIPRNVSEVDGPSSFSGFVGAFMQLQSLFMVSMFRLQVWESGGPAVKKSSSSG